MIYNMIAKGSGGSPAISVVDTPDSGGGTVRTITASGATIPTPASDISKLILNGVTQMDVTDTTATVSDVASGKVFTQVDGVKGTGTASGGYSVDDIASANVSGDLVITEGTIKAYSFYGNNGITSVSAPNATLIKEGAFMNCGSVSFNFPEVTSVESRAFNYCTSDLYLPKCTTIATGSQVWAGGSSGSWLILPRCTTAIGSDGMRGAYWGKMDLGFVPSLGARAIYQGSNKTILILRSTSVVPASDTNAIGALTSSTVVYVPSSLISQYQTATGWSAKGCTFSAIENSPYEALDWYENV